MAGLSLEGLRILGTREGEGGQTQFGGSWEKGGPRRLRLLCLIM